MLHYSKLLKQILIFIDAWLKYFNPPITFEYLHLSISDQ